MKYLVTGGAGFIGSHLAEELVNRNHDVIILDNLFSGAIENIKLFIDRKNISFIEGSINDFRLLKDLFENVDGIFHEAAIPSVSRSLKNPFATNEANIAGTLNVLIAAKDAGIKNLVFASSSSVYGDTPVLPKHEDMKPKPKSPYAVSKLTGEYYCSVFSELYGIKTAALRYFNVFGPRQDPTSEYSAVIPKFISRILRNESPLIYGDGTQTRDFTYVKDIVHANIRAMESNADGIFNVAYGSRISLNDLARMIMEIQGVSMGIKYDSPRPGDVHDSLADISAAKKVFNYFPSYTVKTGLKETIRWYKEQ
jgi:UDP-glucose 4-epimerase